MDAIARSRRFSELADGAGGRVLEVLGLEVVGVEAVIAVVYVIDRCRIGGVEESSFIIVAGLPLGELCCVKSSRI